MRSREHRLVDLVLEDLMYAYCVGQSVRPKEISDRAAVCGLDLVWNERGMRTVRIRGTPGEEAALARAWAAEKPSAD